LHPGGKSIPAAFIPLHKDGKMQDLVVEGQGKAGQIL
jgi:hypothetical protein